MKALYAIVGMRFRGAEDFVRKLPAGTQLRLIREPTNKHDPFAVQVWAEDMHIGYVKATQVRPLAEYLDHYATFKNEKVETRGVFVPGQPPSVEVEE